MKNLNIIVILLIVTLTISCGGDEENNPETENIEEIILDEELKEGIQFDVSNIHVPENFNQTIPGIQLVTIQSLINIQTPLLIIDEVATVEEISILDDTLYQTRTSDNDCGLPTDIYTQRYQWGFSGFTYTTEVGQNSNYNFWITEYKFSDNNETETATIFGRERRGDEVEGCIFISTEGESNAKLEWSVSTGGNTEGDTILKYTLYSENNRVITTMSIKEDGSGSSRVIEVDDISGSTIEDISYWWTADGQVTFSS